MISRRDFLKVASLSAVAGVGLSSIRPNVAVKTDEGNVEFVPSICAMCPAGCGILAEVVDGKVKRILGNPDHPVNRGKICAKGNAGVDRLYNPDRLKNPMVRVGNRGEWNFKEVSWDRAIEEVAKRLKEFIDEGHPEYIGVIGGWLPCSYYRPFFGAFLKALGTPNGTGIPPASCFIAKAIGWKSVYGFGAHPEIATDYEHARYIVVLRRNIAGSCSVTHASRFGQNRRKFKLVVLDPRFSETSAKADLWLPIKPGSDLAFLLAMMNVIVNEKLYDKEFLMKYTNAPMLLKDEKPYKIWKDGEKIRYLVFDLAKGSAVQHENAVLPALEGEFEVNGEKVIPVFEALKRRIKDYTPEWAEGITGVPAEKIREVAREFALRRGVIDSGWHDPKYLNTVLTWRCAGILNALVGSVNRDGGLLFTGLAQFSGASEVSEASPNSVLRMWAEKKGIATANLGHTFQAYYDAITKGDPYPIKAMIIIGNNFLNNLPDRRKWENALKKLDFVLAVDILPQDHIAYADVVLPESTYLEKDDPLFPIPYVPYFGFHTRVKAVEPIYNTKHVIEMMVDICRALGVEDKYFQALSKILKVDYAKLKSYYLSEGVAGIRRAQAEAKGLNVNEIAERGFVVLKDRKEVVGYMPYKRELPTPTGKVEIYSFMLDALSKKVKNPYWDALIKWVPPKIYEKKLEVDEFYIVYSRAPLTTHCSTQDNKLLMKLLKDLSIFYTGVWINSKRAKKLGIKSGDKVIIESPSTGDKTLAVAFVNDLVREDTIFVLSGFGQTSAKLRNKVEGPAFNRLMPIQFDPLSGSTLAHEFVVRVRRF
ncbi:molybdopterin-dependent oxidoreductase [Archaeoglobus sp.]